MPAIFHLVCRILKGCYRIFCWVRACVVNLLFTLFIVSFFFLVGSIGELLNSNTYAIKLDRPMALTLDLNGVLSDNGENSPLIKQIIQSELGGNSPARISTFDVVRVIKAAQNDERITGLVLDLSYFQGGDIASLHDIGEQIVQFKQSKKPVIAIGDRYSQSQYYLASFADEIYLNKAGSIGLTGLNYRTLYFKSLLNKIEAVPHIFRVGSYKSAVEPFLRDDMSEEARQNATLWLNQLWGSLRDDIASNRSIAPQQVIADNFADYWKGYEAVRGDDAQYALQRKLVTHLFTSEEITQHLIEKFGKDKDVIYQHIDFLSYLDKLPQRSQHYERDKIAIVNIEGEIIWGSSGEGKVGHETVIAQLKAIKQDPYVRGVIIRINSPGGSALASELIRQAIVEVQSQKIPVMTSMGGMAASGGYWIASTSDEIIASPYTITGSIGIFGLAMSFEKTADNLGIHEDGISTVNFAQSTPFKTLSTAQSQLIQLNIENGYDKFIQLVSEGRHLSKKAVEQVAQGQVWSGKQALQFKLVDKLGNFETAVEHITKLINQQRQQHHQSEFQHLDLEWFTESNNTLLGGVFEQMNLKNLFMQMWLPHAEKVQQSARVSGILTQFNDPKQSYLYCLNCGVIQ